jgi:hypothetical protein
MDESGRRVEGGNEEEKSWRVEGHGCLGVPSLSNAHCASTCSSETCEASHATIFTEFSVKMILPSSTVDRCWMEGEGCVVTEGRIGSSMIASAVRR